MLYKRLIPAFCILLLTLVIACNRGGESNDGPVLDEPDLPEDVAGLVDLLGQPQLPSRNLVIERLVEKGEEAIGPLIEAFDEGGEPQTGAVNVLSRIGEPAIPALIEALSTEQYYRRIGAVMTLGEIGPPAESAIEPMISLFQFAVKSEKVTIIQALARISHGDDVIFLLTASLVVEDLRWETLRVLGDIGPEAAAAVPSMLEYIDSEETQTRIEVIQAVEGFGPMEEIVEAIAGRVTDPEQRVRHLAVQVLGRFGPAAVSAVPELASALLDEDADVQRTAAKALGQIGPGSSGVIDALVDALAAEDPQVRREAAWALGQIGPAASGAIDALNQRVLSDTFEYVRTTAEESISLIESGS